MDSSTNFRKGMEKGSSGLPSMSNVSSSGPITLVGALVRFLKRTGVRSFFNSVATVRIKIKIDFRHKVHAC